MRTVVLLMLIAIVGSGCVTRIQPKSAFNPPPIEPMNQFGEFDLRQVTVAASASDSRINPRAVARIQANVQDRVTPTLDVFVAANDSDRRLIIEPVIEEMKFVGPVVRTIFTWVAGSSAVRMIVKMTDAETGEVIAQPEFYQRAHGYSGGWSFGATDYAMLVRIASVIDQYLKRNYETAVGGPTGLESESDD